MERTTDLFPIGSAPERRGSGKGRLKGGGLLDQLRPMRAFLAVSIHGSTARAADAIFLSQPAVARAVKHFEDACGIALFDRATRGMIATPVGRRLASRAATVFKHLADGASDAIAAAPVDAKRQARPERFQAAVTPSQLRALLAIGRSGSEAEAARTLGVTQPAVHQALHGLEQIFEIRLFYRLVFGTRSTPAGEALLRRVKLARAEIDAMEGDIAMWRGDVRGRVVVGVLPLSVSIFLPQAISKVQAHHPDISIEIVDGTYESLVGRLLSAEVDVIAGALRSRDAHDELQHQHLFSDELVVVARAGHPCLQRTRTSLRDLLRWQWVTPLPGTPAARALDRVFADAKLASPGKGLQASSRASTIALVVQSDRLALASRGDVEADDRGGALCIVPTRLAGTERPIGLTTRAVGQPSHDLQLFINACREVVEEAGL